MSHWSGDLDELKGKEIIVVDEVDIGGSYEFDIVAVVKTDEGLHVVSTSGCSCPSYEEQARYDAGPFDTISAALAHVGESHRALMQSA